MFRLWANRLSFLLQFEIGYVTDRSAVLHLFTAPTIASSRQLLLMTLLGLWAIVDENEDVLATTY